MYAAFRGELFKLVRRPGIWVLVGLFLALAILIGYAITYLIYTFPPSGSSQGLPPGTTLSDFKVALYPENVVKQTLSQWGVLGGVFALIVGVLTQGSEYGWGTITAAEGARKHEGRTAVAIATDADFVQATLDLGKITEELKKKVVSGELTKEKANAELGAKRNEIRARAGFSMKVTCGKPALEQKELDAFSKELQAARKAYAGSADEKQIAEEKKAAASGGK
jgi:hypothetical protein